MLDGYGSMQDEIGNIQRRCAIPALLLIFLAFSLVSQSCALPKSDAFPIVVHSASITLQWDPPVSGPLAASSIAFYYVYYCKHSTRAWHFIGQAPASSSPRLKVAHDDLGCGEFDFAVSTIMLSGMESDFHTSLDFSADPVGGWYLIWQ
jgi:hypothetical protein